MSACEWKVGDKALVEVEVTWTNGVGDVQCSIGDDEGYFLPVSALRPVGDVLRRQPGRSEGEIKAEALREAADAMRLAKEPWHWNLRDPLGAYDAVSPDLWLERRAARIAGATEVGDE